MPRITIDCYDDQHAAAGALDSLREVGLHPGDVAAAWPAAGAAPSGLEAVTPLELFEAPVESLGRVQFTGWLAEAARNACAAGPGLDLRTLLRAEGVSFPSRQDLEDQHRP